MRKSRNWTVSLITLFLIVLGLIYLSDNSDISVDNESLVEEMSVAVLPFKNLSGSTELQYFTDGMMDAILTDLVSYSELKVISRTSAEQYRNTIKTIPQIANELDVSFVLEGSVQLQDNSVRIIAQLIRADDEDHVWAKTFDRDLSDVFVVQTEIARLVAEELQGKMLLADDNKQAVFAHQQYGCLRFTFKRGAVSQKFLL